MHMIGRKLPPVTFRTRVRDESVEGPNPFRWENKTTDDYFKGKRVVLFSLTGAFTPTCSTYQLPDFDTLSPEFQPKGIDERNCHAVNGAIVINAGGNKQDLNKQNLLTDSTG